MKVLITGSTGLIGSALAAFLRNKNEEVYELVRTQDHLLPNQIFWNPDEEVLDSASLEGFDAIVHLAGESIVGRWTEAKKKRIEESRVKGTQLLSQAICQLKHPPSVLISASAIGYYGSPGNLPLTEESSAGSGFLARVCKQWEAATQPVAEKGIRVVQLRIGVVLSPEGGALQQMLPIFKMGVGGRMGDGSQYMSWIAIQDLIRIIDDVIHQEHVAGPINAVSPHPVTNQEFIDTLGRVLKRPSFLFMPAFMVKLTFGEMGDELLLRSMRVEPKRLKEMGFKFDYPYLEGALIDLLD